MKSRNLAWLWESVKAARPRRQRLALLLPGLAALLLVPWLSRVILDMPLAPPRQHSIAAGA